MEGYRVTFVISQYTLTPLHHYTLTPLHPYTLTPLFVVELYTFRGGGATLVFTK